MFLTCARCGQQNYSNASQCAYCGAALSNAYAVPPPPPPMPFGATNAPGFATGTSPGKGTEASAASTQPQIGQLIDNKYRIERVLGEGGMGVVYVALDINADQRVVIKSIRSEFANRGDFRERTLAEGKALAKIDHQNVVRFNSIINSSETNELYIVMQFIEGESLDKTLEKANATGQKLPIPEIIRIFKQVLDGIAAAHKEGLIHRDLKPANVIVRAKDGVAKVMDFGIAKTEGATKGPTQAGGVVGSLWYMAPEQIKGARDLDKRLDVYALGIMLYELSTGSVPFDGETEYDIMTKQIGETVPPVRRVRPEAPAWLDEAIARATQKDRATRFQSCEEMKSFIEQYDGGIQVPRSMTALDNPNVGTVPPLAYVEPVLSESTVLAQDASIPTLVPPQGPTDYSYPSSKKSSNTMLFAILGVVAVLGGGVGIYFATQSKPKPVQASGGDDTTTHEDKHKDDKPNKKNKGAGVDSKDNTDSPEKKPSSEKKKPSPLEGLAGMWKSKDTNKLLSAELNSIKELEFKVVDPKQFTNYEKDETRFTLAMGKDGKSIRVIDRFRASSPSPYISADAKNKCTKPFEAYNGQDLEATSLSNNELEVTFIQGSAQFKYLEGKVLDCTMGEPKGVLKQKFIRQ